MLKELAEHLISRYIILPMINGTGYNPVNTAFVATIFIIASWLVYRLMKSYDFGKSTCIKLIPFIATGSVIRAMKDHGMVHSLIFITPWIWLLFLGIGLALIAMTKRIESLSVYGIFALSVILALYPMHHISRIWLMLTGFLGSIYAVRIVEALIPNMKSYRFYFMFQMFDASTTFAGVSSGFFEQHVLARAFISMLGPAGIYALKFALLIPAFIIIDRESGKLKEFLLFLVFLVATGPGIRNLMTMIY